MTKLHKVYIVGVLCLICVAGFVVAPGVGDNEVIVEEYISTLNGSYIKKQLSELTRDEMISETIEETEDSKEDTPVKPPSIISGKVPENLDANAWEYYIQSMNIDDKRKRFCARAILQVKRGIPYSQNGVGGQRDKAEPAFLDCSSLVYNSVIYSNLSPLPSMTTAGQINDIIVKQIKDLLPGDVVCYRKWDAGGHIMIYLGQNSGGPVWCHAASTKRGLVIDNRSFEDISNKKYKALKFGCLPCLNGVS